MSYQDNSIPLHVCEDEVLGKGGFGFVCKGELRLNADSVRVYVCVCAYMCIYVCLCVTCVFACFLVHLFVCLCVRACVVYQHSDDNR